MAKLGVGTDIIDILYSCTIGRVLRYCLVAWCANATKAYVEHVDSIIDNIIGKASKVVGIPPLNTDTI